MLIRLCGVVAYARIERQYDKHNASRRYDQARGQHRRARYRRAFNEQIYTDSGKHETQHGANNQENLCALLPRRHFVKPIASGTFHSVLRNGLPVLLDVQARPFYKRVDMLIRPFLYFVFIPLRVRFERFE